MKLKGKNILITGGSGFIGTNLGLSLKKLSASVENFDLENGRDIRNTTQTSRFIKRGYDAIYHLAGTSGSSKSTHSALQNFEANTIATLKIIELILEYSPDTKLVLSGSRLEYGQAKHLPVDENHPTQPNSAYGLTKLLATELALMYAKKNQLHTTIFRTSNVYGPHKKGKFYGYNVINHFIDLARDNGVIEVFGSGEQTRDYIYIDDLVRAFILALEPVADGKIYNLGYGEPIKFKKMVESIINIVGKGKINYVPWPADFKSVETGSYVTDISKVKKELGFRPLVSFAEGIALTYKNS